jgi:hypothetical protein
MDKVVVCPTCNHANPPGYSFCEQCGAPLPKDTDKGVVCPKCGHANPSDFNFCEQCAAPLPKPMPQPQKTRTFCPQCGAQNPSGYRFCAQCGAALPAREPVAILSSPPSKGKIGRALWIGLPIVIILLGGIVAAALIVGSTLGNQGTDSNIPHIDNLANITQTEAAEIGISIIEDEYPELTNVQPIVDQSTTMGHNIYQVSFSKDVPVGHNSYRQVVIVSIDTDDGSIMISESD